MLMKIIEQLSDQMEEEMHDAEMYIEMAIKWKEDDALLAKMYSTLSEDEVKHALMLHESGVRLIDQYVQSGRDLPTEMKAVYDYLHEKHMKRFNAIKIQQAMFREQ